MSITYIDPDNYSEIPIEGVHYMPITKTAVINALQFTPIDPSNVGVANGIASLDENGKIPSSQLPESVNITYNSETEKLSFGN